MVEGELAKTVAILHDVIEDTDVVLQEIREKFGDTVALAVDACTKQDGETYDRYIARVLANQIAIQVKLADITHNVSSLPVDGRKITRLRNERYALATFILKNMEGIAINP